MSGYTVYVTPTAWSEIKDLPGHMRQRIRRAITALAHEPRPAESKALVGIIPDETRAAPAGGTSADAQSHVPAHELRRIRLDRWRIVYAITEREQVIDVLTVRKRPPYDYGDLARLLAEL